MNRNVILLVCALIINACSCGGGRIPKAGPVNNRTNSIIQKGSSRVATVRDKQNCLKLPQITAEDDIVNHIGFCASYNHNTLCPNWVAYELTDEEVNGTCKGKQSFQWDPILKGKRSNREDYKNDEDWDKGHMAPKADMKWSVQAYEESFYLTNICPQNHSFNAGIWNSLEKLVRRVAIQYGRAYIIVGPIIGDCINGTLGESKVYIPDKFFKAIIVPKNNIYSGIAFVMDNSPINGTMRSCAMSIDSLETILNRDLFVALDDKIEPIVESQIIYSDWGL